MKWLLSVLFLIVFSGCSVVSPGERGVRVSLGKVSDKALEPGPYFWLPFVYGMAQLDVQIQKNVVQTSAASRDQQEITTMVAVNWSLDPNKVVEVYKDIGGLYAVDENIIDPAIAEILKSSTAKRSAEEILTKRQELKAEIDETLRKRLASYGVLIHDVSITNLKFGDDYMKAVERKQIAEQQAKEAEYIAQRAIKEADATVNLAKGQAESQRLLKTSTSPEVLKLKYLEKWDGKLPTIMSGGTSGLMLNVGDLSK